MINVPSLLLYMFVQLFTPGPSNFMSMYSAALYGMKGAKGYLLGTMCGYSVKLVLCGLLSLALAQIVPQAVPYLKWVGGAYLLYLAVQVLLSSRKEKERPQGEQAGSSTFLSGILLQCLNIKSWVFGLTVFSMYITPYTTATGDILFWALVSCVIMIGCTLCWAAFGNAMRRVYAKYRFAFHIVMAVVLVYCAIMAVL